MRYAIENEKVRYAVDGDSRNASFIYKQTGHEYILSPGALWKMIYSVRDTEREEVPVWACNQSADVEAGENVLTLRYDTLLGEDGRRIDASLIVTLCLDAQGLRARVHIENRDPDVILQEIQLTPVSGARSLDGDPENDFIAWPLDLGMKVRAPALTDIAAYLGFRKYERHDQFHTDMDGLYQDGNNCTMQWYDWYNDREGLYCGGEDLSRQTLGLHVERNVAENVLSFGFVFYPMIGEGEGYRSPDIVFYPHTGDWHAGAKMYRAFMDASGGFRVPETPAWCREMTGWLRVILKQQHGECNFTYHDIPRLYDELSSAGMKTLYLLGWEKNGFSNKWPDYEVDERMGGREALERGIRYVHAKGGRVIMFLSYALIDRRSRFYLEEGGRDCTIRSLWDDDVAFGETYCGEGTYRKIGNPVLNMFFACPGAPAWQDKMKEAAKICLDLGADGVLYDIGATKPYFCYARNHTHSKPSRSHERKADNYRGLREYVKSWGADKGILMEHNMDIYSQHMDLCHSTVTRPDRRLWEPAGAEDLAAAREDVRLPEMYRCTFPEMRMTNRECGEDEDHYKAFAGYSFLMGLTFDMTIHRCCGTLKDIPDYAAYLTRLIGDYEANADCILRGRFTDTDGFQKDNPYVLAKGFMSDAGSFAVTLWNPTGHEQTVTLTAPDHAPVTVVLPAEEAAAVRLYEGGAS